MYVYINKKNNRERESLTLKYFTTTTTTKIFYFIFTYSHFIVILTPSVRPANEPLTHAMSFTLKNLQSGSVYEAIVQAKNRYGWNEVSFLLFCDLFKDFLLVLLFTDQGIVSLTEKWFKRF